ncbi:MAG: hypothetical protein IPP40_07190 [bacterium]|nr:hypothetical protein [bacterium]
MGWCGVYIHGQNGETLDPVFGPENPIVSCNQCGSRQTLRIDTYPHDVFVNSERWWIVNDENDQPIYRISANDYDDINIPLELGQIVEIFFENEDTHYVWYFFTATNEGTDDDGNRLFDATMKAHLSISFNEWGPVCNRTVGEMWDAFGDESNWQYYFFTIWDGDGSGASNVEIHQATDQLNISVGDNK